MGNSINVHFEIQQLNFYCASIYQAPRSSGMHAHARVWLKAWMECVERTVGLQQITTDSSQERWRMN